MTLARKKARSPAWSPLTSVLAPSALAAAWASGQSVGYDFESEWTVGAAYTFKATEKLSITPQVIYWDSVGFTNADAVGLPTSTSNTSSLPA
ncbi:MAG: hypothetical protein U5N27_01510 [Rhizobium sp.]|nr:hypothetical protein [Rhizobium sp.]